jgi:hypothetical protein
MLGPGDIDYRVPRNRVNPQTAVRRQCLYCMGGGRKGSEYVRNCRSEKCPLWPYREKKGGRVYLRLIRKYCFHCCGWELDEKGNLDPKYREGRQAEARRESANCTGWECPFWPYRPKTTPYDGVRHGRFTSLVQPDFVSGKGG